MNMQRWGRDGGGAWKLRPPFPLPFPIFHLAVTHYKHNKPVIEYIQHIPEPPFPSIYLAPGLIFEKELDFKMRKAERTRLQNESERVSCKSTSQVPIKEEKKEEERFLVSGHYQKGEWRHYVSPKSGTKEDSELLSL